MKSILIILSLVMTLFAEPSFQQIQSLIETHNYKQAKFALQLVIANHPNSSKAYYTLAQAEAGLGNLPAAQEALTHAKAFNSSLDFVPITQLEKLEQAITPQTHLIKPVESSNGFVVLFILVVLSISGAIWYFFIRKPKPAPEPEQPSTKYSPTYTSRAKPYSTSYTSTAKYTPSPASGSAPRVDSTASSAEVHHHYHSDSGMGTAGTILTAGLTAAAVTSMMDYSQPAPIVTPVYPEPTSSSWEDSKPTYTSSYSSDYEDSTSRSSSWSDSSSSSSSWSDSSSSSSSSWD